MYIQYSTLKIINTVHLKVSFLSRDKKSADKTSYTAKRFCIPPPVKDARMRWHTDRVTSLSAQD